MQIIFGGFVFDSVMIATDGSKQSEKAAKVGVELAELSGGKVTAVYVADTGRYVSPIGGLSPHTVNEVITGMREVMQEEGKAATRYVEEAASTAGVPFEKKIAEGHPASELMKIAEEAPMDVIVMGHIGRTGLDKFILGSVADKVVRNSKVLVLVVH